MRKLFFIVLVCAISTLFAYRFETNLFTFKSLTYKITTPEETFYAGVEIKGSKDNYEVMYWTKFTAKGEQISLAEIMIPHWWTFMATSFAYAGILEMANLESPVPLSYGNMKVVAEGEEKVGQYKGKKYTFYVNDIPQISWVIKKDIPLALKTVLVNDKIVIELEDFQFR
ncbi:hypothetical protein [Pseudothermotoga thermarum]|uniref:Uncharacterized protein n=1 Tax=Pseudothermotoga thermarum DSM 5069 TaxID=688269 RepID=F7YUU9_9THEM|nr:hypothetical protein [Pseudothermotoga thermarum]AEH51509.1 hypothetical protein Theth_1452 [Pseudothermotoga thermarum DSM 5069]